jgi:hypothetical protein
MSCFFQDLTTEQNSRIGMLKLTYEATGSSSTCVHYVFTYALSVIALHIFFISVLFEHLPKTSSFVAALIYANHCEEILDGCCW